MAKPAFPEGLGEPHIAGVSPIHRHASPLSLLILGIIVAAALGGAFGGGAYDRLQTDGEAARLEVTTPEVLRNGMFFETVIRAEAKQPISNLVVGVEPSLWNKLTQNSMIPAASDESFEDGFFRFSYGPLESGEDLEVKMDFQINPDLVGGTRGQVALFDGDERLVAIPVFMEVRP